MCMKIDCPKKIVSNIPVLASVCFMMSVYLTQYPWLEACCISNIDTIQNFAAGIKQDYAAVKAALETDWSNAQTEGQVNRLKMLKRQMYGRAGLDLLRIRILYPSKSTKLA